MVEVSMGVFKFSGLKPILRAQIIINIYMMVKPRPNEYNIS